MGRIVRVMLATHPYKNWPLHVTLFTEEAVQGWWNANKKASTPLPPGLTCKVELEGVHGKSGHPGSGRQGPIDVTDGVCHIPCGAVLGLPTHWCRAIHNSIYGKTHRITCFEAKIDVFCLQPAHDRLHCG